MNDSIVNHIAKAFEAMRNCEKQGNSAWETVHRAAIESLVANWLPSGSGFDSGTQFDFDRSKPDRLVFQTAFHHMTEHGVYDGWTQHSVTVAPSFVFGFGVDVSGRNRNDIKDYIAETFHDALSGVVDNDSAYGRDSASA